MARLTPSQIYGYAINAGFPSTTATKMVAIAMRESSGVPTAHNGVRPDDSYGLWQINMLGSMGVERRRQLGITSNDQLFDPATNARAAYLIWAGDDRNLERHWYIDRPMYRERYEQYLPLAQSAAIEWSRSGGVVAGGGGGSSGSGNVLDGITVGGWDWSDVWSGGGSQTIAGTGDNGMLIAGLLAAAILVVML